MSYCRIGLCAILGSALTTITPLTAQPEPGKADQERMIGSWRIAKMVTRSGEQLPNEFVSVLRLSFAKDGKASFGLLDEEVVPLQYSMAKPGLIELRGGGQVLPGIY